MTPDHGRPTLSFVDALARLAAADLTPGPSLVQTIRTLGSTDPEYFHNDVSGGLGLQQVPEELDRLADCLVRRFAGRPLRYLEVGIGSCATAIFLAHLFRAHSIAATMAAVDNFDYERRGVLAEQQARLAWCREHLGLTFAEIDTRTPAFAQWLEGQQFDVVLVDGDHSFAGCLWDTVQCLPALAPDGLLILHDITSQACPGVGEVFALAREVATAYHAFSHAETCGIGVLEGLGGGTGTDAMRTRALRSALTRVDQLELRAAQFEALTSSPRAVLTRVLPHAVRARWSRRTD